MENDIVFDKRDISKRRVEKAIKQANSDGIGRSELLRETRIMAKDLNPIIDTLEQERKILAPIKHETAAHGKEGAYSEIRYFWKEND